MAGNPITDAGFEFGEAWEFYQNGHSVDVRTTDGAPYGGSYHARAYLEVATGGGGGLGGFGGGGSPSSDTTRFGQQINLPTDSADRRLRYWLRLDGSMSSNGRCTVLLYDDHTSVEVPTASEIYSEVHFANVPVGSYAEQVSAPISVPSHGRVTLVVVTSYNGTPAEIANCSWYFDTWKFLTDEEYDADMKRRAIRDAVVTAIQGVTTGNGYTYTVAEVVTEPIRLDKIDKWPHVQVVYGDERRELNEMHRKRATLRLFLGVYAKDTGAVSAEAQLDQLSADIETVLETQTDNQWLGLGYIDNVNVTDADFFEAEDDSQRGKRMYIVTVAITYRYDRLDP